MLDTLISAQPVSDATMGWLSDMYEEGGQGSLSHKGKTFIEDQRSSLSCIVPN